MFSLFLVKNLNNNIVVVVLRNNYCFEVESENLEHFEELYSNQRKDYWFADFMHTTPIRR